MTTLNELTETLETLSSQLAKARDEILSKLEALTEALQNGELSPDASAALDDLRTVAQSLDDIVPDVPPETGEA